MTIAAANRALLAKRMTFGMRSLLLGLARPGPQPTDCPRLSRALVKQRFVNLDVALRHCGNVAARMETNSNG
jgi:hypothetical protein